MRKFALALVAVTFGLCLAATSSAQTSRRSGGRTAGTVAIGTPVHGELRRGDPLYEGLFSDTYIFNGVAGNRVEFRLEAEGEFDPIIVVMQGSLNVAFNADDELSLRPLRSSRTELTVRNDGEFRVRVYTQLPDQGGAYTLTVVDGATADQERPELAAQRERYIADLRMRADNFLNSGANAQALVAYDEALTFDPYNVNMHINRGVARFRSNRFLEAQMDFNVALGFDPNNAQARANYNVTQQILDADIQRQLAEGRAAREAVYAENDRRDRQAAAIVGAVVGVYNAQNTQPQPATTTYAPPAQQQTSVPSQAVSRPTPTGPDNTHVQANDARACVTPQTVGRTNYLHNSCSFTIELAFCEATQCGGSQGPGQLVSVHAGSSWPVLSVVRWAACKNPNSIIAHFDRPNLEYECPDRLQPH